MPDSTAITGPAPQPALGPAGLPAPPSRWRDNAVLVAVGVLGLAWYHRVDVISGFSAISGDTGDTRLVTFLLEHGWRALNGTAPIASPPMFHPAAGTFGYADAFVLHGLVFWPLRALGVDALTAMQGALIAWNGLTYASGAWLLRRELRLGVIASAAGAALFAYNSAKFNQFVHIQLQPLALLPVLVAVVLRLGRATPVLDRRVAFRRLATLALLLNLQLLSGVYVAWFFCFWCLLFALVLAAMAPTRAWLLQRARAWRRPLAGAGCVFGIGLVPLLLLYVPVLRETGWRSYGDAQGMIPQWFSPLLMGDTNLLWGWVEGALPGLYAMNFWWEHRIGLGAVVTLGWLVLAVAAGRALLQEMAVLQEMAPQAGPHPSTAAPTLPPRLVGIALVLSVSLFYLLGMKYFGRSPWWFAFHTVPGIKGIRAVARYVVVLALPISIGLALALDGLLARAGRLPAHRRRWAQFGLVGLAALALVEQAGTRQGYDKQRELARLDRLAARLPAGCDAFYITSHPASKLSNTEVQIDAMFVAQRTGVPTLNGYSGQDPKGWKLYFIREPAYLSLVNTWVQERHVAGLVCRLDDPD
ncbi:MAG: hypothetical protein EXR79_16080 [Myxococcales bacterium]|nr:hypothetical protein [Myxococcales bacterium]